MLMSSGDFSIRKVRQICLGQGDLSELGHSAYFALKMVEKEPQSRYIRFYGRRQAEISASVRGDSGWHPLGCVFARSEAT